MKISGLLALVLALCLVCAAVAGNGSRPKRGAAQRRLLEESDGRHDGHHGKTGQHKHEEGEHHGGKYEDDVDHEDDDYGDHDDEDHDDDDCDDDDDLRGGDGRYSKVGWLNNHGCKKKGNDINQTHKRIILAIAMPAGFLFLLGSTCFCYLRRRRANTESIPSGITSSHYLDQGNQDQLHRMAWAPDPIKTPMASSGIVFAEPYPSGALQTVSDDAQSIASEMTFSSSMVQPGRT